jgi:flagellin
MLAIKNNIMAANAARHLGKAYDSLAKSVERLSSGLRINSAKDDAAGMAVRELIRADIAVLQQGARNAQDGISMLQTMEGAMAVIDENLIRMKELAEQAATGSYSSAQRVIMNSEFSEMGAEIDRIAGSTTFNGNNLINNTNGVDIHVGSTDKITITGQDMRTSALGVQAGNSGEQAEAEYGVATTGTTWLTLTNTGAAAGNSLTITFSDGGVAEDTITVATGAIATTSYTLQQVIDLINAESQNLGNDASGNSKNYQMASAKYEAATGKYYLKLNSRLSGADGVSIKLQTGNDTAATLGIVAAKATNLEQTVADVWDGGGAASGDSFQKAAGTGVNILTAAAAEAALVSLTTAITTKDSARASFGYKMNRLESTVSILDIQAENLLTAESRISDVDVATEMAALTRTQVLSQAGIAMLTQANNMPQMALTLLRG